MLSAILVVGAAGMYGMPACGDTQISAGSLVNCTAGDVQFTNWSFSAPRYLGVATIQIQVPAAGQYATDPEIVTLRFYVRQHRLLFRLHGHLGFDV